MSVLCNAVKHLGKLFQFLFCVHISNSKSLFSNNVFINYLQLSLIFIGYQVFEIVEQGNILMPNMCFLIGIELARARSLKKKFQKCQ